MNDLGLSKWAVGRRVADGRLHRLYRGVYAVGHRNLTYKGRWLAAVLACGEGAVLSHHHALALWQMRMRPSGPIHVTVVGRGRRSTARIRVHAVRRLAPEDTCTIDAIPVTNVARTLLDFAEVAGPQQLRHALEAGERREVLDGYQIAAVLERNPGRHGIKPLRAALARITDSAPWTQSELERHFLALVRAARLPEPQCNVMVEGLLVDFYWRSSRLVVEADSWGFHRTRAEFEADRRRDAALLLVDIRTLRLTQRRIAGEPARVGKEVAKLLERR